MTFVSKKNQMDCKLATKAFMFIRNPLFDKLYLEIGYLHARDILVNRIINDSYHDCNSRTGECVDLNINLKSHRRHETPHSSGIYSSSSAISTLMFYFNGACSTFKLID